MAEFPTDFVAIGAVEYVYTTHVIHQEQFYVHLDTRSSILEEIMDALETRYSQLGPNDKTLPQIRLGGLCAAKFTDDNNWYRVKITGLLNSGLIEVNFVDYGNTDYVSPDRVKKLDPDLMQYPVQSYRCALAGVSCKHGLWPPELQVQFEDLVVDKKCKAVFTDKTGEDIYLLDMYDENGLYINRLFGAVDKKSPPVNTKVNGNGSGDVQGFASISWKGGQKVPAVVVYVKNPEIFWCQEVAHTNNIIILSEELSRLHMTQGMGLLQNVRPGAICAAKFHEDGAWYRGIIQSVSGNKSQVYFVDYGNTESVDLDSLCELREEFRRLPALAVKCSLSSFGGASGNQWSTGAIEEFEKLVVDREFEVSVIKKQHDGFEVSLLDIEENKDVGSQLKQALGQANIKAKTPPKPVNMNNNSQSRPTGRGLDLPVGSTSNVFLSWVDNPADFWVQQEELTDVLDKLSDDLQEYYAQPRPMALSAPGAFVIARFPEDQQWYRGLVVKEFEEEVKVLFIDYGNADIIPKTELRQVNPQFGQVDPLALRCGLKGVKPLPQDNTWSVDAKEFLEKITDKGCQCEVLSKNDAYRFVALSVNGKDVAQELVALAVVAGSQPPQVKPNIPSYSPCPRLQDNQTELAMVTHIDSPHSFWVQLSKNNSELDVLMEKLDSHYSEDGGTPITKPVVGQACVAQYSQDNSWYRAFITNILPSGCDVHFVDYGNREQVASNVVCVIEPRFLDLPLQAIKCSLALPDVSHLKDTLSDLVLEKDVTLKVLSSGTDFPAVDLTIDGQSVCSLLRNLGSGTNESKGRSPDIQPAKSIPVGSTVKAFISMIHSPDKFFLQMAGVDDELATLMEQLAGKYIPQGVPVISQPSQGMSCVALYEEDQQWYRGRITAVQGDRCQVLFVDYGNEELISNNLIKTLVQEFAKSPILSYQCSLYGVKTNVWSESAIAFFESVVNEQELTCTFVSNSAVTVLCNGEDVASKLISSGHCQAAGGPGPKSPLSVSTSQSGFGNRSPKSPGFGPVKDESSPRGFGGKRREDRGFGEGREQNRGFGGGRQNDRGFGGDGEEKRGFRGGRQNDRGFGDDREEKRGYGGGRRDDRGDRREKSGFGGGDSSFGRSDDGSDRGGFKSRSRDGDSGGFGDRGSGFGGGRRERNSSTGSSSNAAATDKFSYPDPPSEPEGALLVHIDDDGTFYLQLPSMEKDILFLAKRLAGSYKSGGPRLKDTAAKGTVCCCKFPDDGSMYRCQVEAINGSKVIVRYMDYGNIAEHTTYDLKFLFPDLLQYPVQAFPCKLRGLDWSIDKADKFGSATLDKDLEVTFTSTTPPYMVDIKTPDGDLLAIMTGQIVPPAPKITTSPSQGGGFGAKSPKGFGSQGGRDTSTPKKSDMTAKRSLNLSSSPRKPSVPKQLFMSQTAPSDSQKAFISHISEEGFFYLQLEKDTGTLDTLTEKLTTVDSSIPHPDLSKGVACAAVFSEDSSWYRAMISEVEGNQFVVTFVDFGNGDKVMKEKICPLSGDLLSTAPLAYQCRFAEEEEALSDTSRAKLEEYLMEHQITVSFSGQSAPFAVTATTSDGQDLHEIVCPSNRFRSQSIPKDVTPVGVCHIEDDGRFFTCFFKQYKAKENLQKRLQEHYSSADAESLENAEIDMPCCHKSSSDDLWYRCKIQTISDSKTEVLYVDRGNTETVEISDLKSLPTNFIKEVPYALECRLKGVDSWTDDLKEKFVDMTQDKILNATFFSSSPPFRVSLARSIELDLLGLNAPEPDSPRKAVDESVISKATMNRSAVFQGGDSYITEVTPDGMFYVQLVAEEEQLQILCDNLEAIMEMLQDAPDSVEVGSILCAKFTEDDVWYRATVETIENDQYTVRFVDYGNNDTLGKDRLALLPDELSTISIPAFAYKCESAVAVSQVEEFKTAVLDKMVAIQVVSTDDDSIFIVNVEVDGQTVLQNHDSEVFTDNVEGEQQDAQISISSKRTTVTIPFVVSPGHFCVQLQSEEGQLDTMMNDLYEEITSLTEGEGLVDDALAVGELCAAFYEESWYRVRVISFEEDQSVQVLYVDHGNTETVSDRSELRALSAKFKSMPFFGHEACLPGIKPADENWTDEAIETFRTLVEEKSLLADLIDTEDDEPWVVQLLDMGTPVHETLIAKGHGVATESVAVSKSTKRVFSDAIESCLIASEEVPPTENTHVKNWKKRIGCVSDTLEELKEVAAFVIQVDSPSEMWCQLESSTDEIEDLGEKLDAAYSSVQDSDKVVGDLNVGDLVVGLYEGEDHASYYRSVVLKSEASENSDESDKVLLRFIDFGNCKSNSKDQILNIREDLCKQPAFSFCCCLDRIQPVEGKWSSDVSSRLTELTNFKELLLKLVGRKQDGTALVEMVVQGSKKSLSDILIEEGLAKSLCIDTSLPVKMEDTKGDVSECLEITQPIMESTAMVEETPTDFPGYTIENAIDGYYRCIELSLYSSYNIVVSDDELPNAFCVQLKEFSSQLSALTEEIDTHVASGAGDDYSPKVGDPCLVEYLSKWYRGLIRMEANGGRWVVVSVDCGWEVCSESVKLRSIPERLMELPGQAIRCYLAGIVSLEPEWSSEAITFFTEYLRERELHISVLESAEDGKYGVSLTEMQNSSTEYSPSLNQLFVEMSFAEIVPGSHIDVQCDMERTLDSDMLNDLEQSFKEEEMNKENAIQSSVDTEASTSQADTFVSTLDEDQLMYKPPVEDGAKFYQLVHLSKADQEGRSLTDRKNTTEDEKNSEELTLTRKDMAFNIASAVDRIDKMGCIDLFPEESLTFDLTSDAESLLEVSKDNKSSMAAKDPGSKSSDVEDKVAKKNIPNNDGDNLHVTIENNESSESANKGGSRSPLYTWSASTSLENDPAVELLKQEKMPVSDNDGEKDLRKQTDTLDSKEGVESVPDVESEHSGPPSFHSAEDLTKEVESDADTGEEQSSNGQIEDSEVVCDEKDVPDDFKDVPGDCEEVPMDELGNEKSEIKEEESQGVGDDEASDKDDEKVESNKDDDKTSGNDENLESTTDVNTAVTDNNSEESPVKEEVMSDVEDERAVSEDKDESET